MSGSRPPGASTGETPLAAHHDAQQRAADYQKLSLLEQSLRRGEKVGAEAAAGEPAAADSPDAAASAPAHVRQIQALLSER